VAGPFDPVKSLRALGDQGPSRFASRHITAPVFTHRAVAARQGHSPRERPSAGDRP
jgi:hypothetical protein